MSSTKRGGQRSEADFYETPHFCTLRLLERLALPGGVWLEPCAGKGAIIEAVSSVRADVRWVACELEEERKGALAERCKSEPVIGDFLTSGPAVWERLGAKKASVCITNPPFRLALPFIEACLPLADVVVMLLRMNFLGSEKRHPFFMQHFPDLYIVPNRPSFDARGSDSIEYGWFVFHPSENTRKFGRLELLGVTPLRDRTLVSPDGS